MKIGILTPHRNDRPEFLEQFKGYIRSQTLQPDAVYYADQEPIGEDVDIVPRYRRGCEYLFGMGVDVVLFMEVDDWYSPDYVRQMVGGWKMRGKPECYGLENTTYYHILANRWLQIRHKGRASCFCTLVTRSVLNITWPKDNDPYLDVAIWKQLRGVAIPVKSPIAIGIKHGIGLVGGGAHESDNKHYQFDDPEGEWLKRVISEKDWEFYKQIKDRHANLLQNNI